MSLSVSSSPSPFISSVQSITASDDEIRNAVVSAELAPLLPALAYVTGDLTLLREDLRPDPQLITLTQAGLNEDQQVAIRELAVQTLIGFRDGGSVLASAPTDAALQQILEFTVGGGDMTEYLPLLDEELSFRGEDRRAPDWTKAQVAPDVDFNVVVIGAGMSGILAGHRLQQAGLPFLILEKNGDVGGTWLQNHYPGCRVDNSNHNYSFSFAQRHDWPLHFSTQDVLYEYFRNCADAFGLRDKIQFGAAVESATWDEHTALWTVVYRHGDGLDHVVTANAVISAVGQLNRPSWPAIDGRSSFEGPSFHSAEWNPDIDLTGKRVVVIGTGCSALQFIPAVAEVAGEVLIMQRTPPWLVPTPDYHEEVGAGLSWLYTHLPSYSELNRFSIFWKTGDASLAGVRVDPSWKSDGSSVSPINDVMRALLTGYLDQQFGDRPDLLAKVTPDYPPGAKRVVRDNGVWATTLKRPNVQLVAGAIGSIDASGLVMTDGSRIDADVIIYGTGYTASEFLVPMRVIGRDGVDLHRQWDGDARAYLGITIPGFPNLFCLYGPNTNIVINGSIIYFSECGVRLILGLLKMGLEAGGAGVEVKREVHDIFNDQVDRENQRMAWGWSSVNSWYKNAHGRVAQNWPFSLLEYWQRTSQPDVDDYLVN